MSKHTPGPWNYGQFRMIGNAPGIDIGSANNSNIALVHHQEEDREPEETAANARLIAAAPDLLAALEEMLDFNSLHTFDQINAMKAARAAIAKATGG